MFERIFRFATITLIAVMVWLYAEGATRKQHTVTFNVTFVAPQNHNLLIDPPTRLISTTVRCASSQLDQVKKLALTPIPIEVTDDPRQIDRPLNLAQVLGEQERIVKMGITVDRTDPETLNLRVERLETKPVRIELATPADLELAGPATFDKDTAEVTLPSSYAGQLEGFKLQARLDANALSGVVAGVQQEREIAIALPPAMASWYHVTFKPAKVKVTFTVKKKEEDLAVSLIPVVITLSPAQFRQYDVEIEPDSRALRDVKLKGPSDAIGKIREGKLKLEAALRLEPEDLEKKIDSKLPELRLPPGVTVDSTLPLIKVKITRREPAP